MAGYLLNVGAFAFWCPLGDLRGNRCHVNIHIHFILLLPLMKNEGSDAFRTKSLFIEFALLKFESF